MQRVRLEAGAHAPVVEGSQAAEAPCQGRGSMEVARRETIFRFYESVGGSDEPGSGAEVLQPAVHTLLPPPLGNIAAMLSTDVGSSEARPPWIELKDGFEWCTLCRLFATHGHLASERHQRRVEWCECEGSEAYSWPDPSNGPPQSWGDPEQFEWRGGWWWCRVCSQWADGFHVEGKRHQRRAPWADWYLLCNSNELKCKAICSDENKAAPAVLADSGQARGGPSHGKQPAWWGVWESSSGKAGQQMVAEPSVHGSPPRPSSTSDGAVWRREWSEKHKQSYFWNEATGESRWDLPAAFISGGGEVEWC